MVVILNGRSEEKSCSIMHVGYKHVITGFIKCFICFKALMNSLRSVLTAFEMTHDIAEKATWC